MTFDYDLNPAYRREQKPVTGTDYIDVPVYNEDGDVIGTETVYFDYEQYGGVMVVNLMTSLLPTQEDIHNALTETFKNVKIEYK
jgi:hypothetical protein